MRRPSLLFAAAIAALALTGCRPSEADLVRGTVEEFTAALSHGNGALACEQLGEAGMSELLLTALRAGVSGSGLEAAHVDRCAVIADRLAAREPSRLAEVSESRITRTILEGDTATVETAAGAYELEETQGRWRLTRFEPVATVLAGHPVPEEPVSVVIARPELSEPALGRTSAGRTRSDSVELSATFEPSDAEVRIEPSSGTVVRRLETGDGRLTAELGLRRGRNEVVLVASAPGRADKEVAVRITRD